ncbi:MAG: outer membrane lipoprotein-sorting protein [Deltaproteobacteria bacterium]|nr:MAG: outer membrane lipoprotein-sorting protein [Deltaproteobacteria bacterium]
MNRPVRARVVRVPRLGASLLGVLGVGVLGVGVLGVGVLGVGVLGASPIGLPLLGIAGSRPAGAAEASATADPTIDELLDAADDIQRGQRSHAVVRMHVKTANYERTMKMESWAEGTDKTLIRILEPPKDAGVATLKVDDNIWNYLPKVDRTMKVPAGMMGESWMGSHFTNDDLVKESRMSEDYDGVIVGRPEDGGRWVIELTPKPDAPVVWGKVVVTMTPDRIPTTIEYFDEKGALVRTLIFDDVQEVEGRRVPMRMRLQPADKPDDVTEIQYETLDFDVEIPPNTFSLQALRR